MGYASENEEHDPSAPRGLARGGHQGRGGGTRQHTPALLMSLSASSQAKSSEEMGHWLGLLLSESGSKTDPEEFTYDYVDADRVSCIVSAAKTSLL